MRIALCICCALLGLGTATEGAAPSVTPLGSYSDALRAPSRIAADTAGRLYVVDTEAGQVAVFDAFGGLTAVHAGLGRPLGIAADSQDWIFLGDEQSGSVTVRDANWNIVYKLGSGDGEFAMPNYIALDPVSNTVYVTDSRANAIKVYSGATLVYSFGTAGVLDGQFDFPTGIAVGSNGEVFVVDQNNDRLQVFDRAGTYLRQISFRAGMLSSRTGRRQGVLLDGAGRVYVVDSFQGVVSVYDAATGSAVTSVGTFGSRKGQLSLPAAAALDPFGRLCVASAGDGRVEVYGIDTYLHLSKTPAARLIPAGASLVLSATAAGPGPFTYQWLRDGAHLIDGGHVGGATNPTLTINGVDGTDGGLYAVIVTGPGGAFTSGTTQVSAQTPPAILGGPTDVTVTRGSDALLSVTATGEALECQWQCNGVNIEGATNTMLTLSDVQPWQAGSYVAVVHNAVGSISSAPATVRVLVPPLVMEFVSIAGLPGAPPLLTINSDPGLNYALTTSTNLANWSLMPSFTNTLGTLTLTDDSATNATPYFYRLQWLP